MLLVSLGNCNLLRFFGGCLRGFCLLHDLWLSVVANRCRGSGGVIWNWSDRKETLVVAFAVRKRIHALYRYQRCNCQRHGCFTSTDNTLVMPYRESA